MANIAQLVNCLQSLFVAHEDQFSVTPNDHVFDMYKGHMGGEAIRARFSAPEVAYDRNGKPAGLWGLNGSASRRDRTLTLTVVNPSPDTPRETEIAIAGARIASCVTRTLTASTLDAHNSFAEPDAVPAPPTVAQAFRRAGSS
jgi:alpha-N-arabinofuranosidase